MDPSRFSNALDAIYGAALAPDLWPNALGGINDLFDCSCVCLIDRNLRTLEGTICSNFDQGSEREFITNWTERNVLRQRTPVWRPGVIETDPEILPRADFARSEYYNEFLSPRGMNHLMRVTLGVEREWIRIVTLNRPTVAGAFEAPDVERFRPLLSHLQRAVRINVQLAKSKVIVGAASEVLEQSSSGVLLLDEHGRVALINRAARVMVAQDDAFVVALDRIKLMQPKRQEALQRLIDGAMGKLAGTSAARGGVMRWPRKSGKPDYAVTIGSVPMTMNYPLRGRSAFVIVTDPSADPADSEDLLRLFFELTDAELRVARGVMQGHSPEQIAGMLDVRLTTVRWHLASLFRKTGTSRQAELVHALLSLRRL
jgi:DNA-binding CsgD family transcriptional regulator